MLFKVYDVSNKFIQYVSLCVDIKTLSNVSNDLYNMICKTNISHFDIVESCYYNYYNSTMSPINIFCSNSGGMIFTLKEVLSDKRLKEIKLFSSLYTSSIKSSPSSIKYVSDGYTANYSYYTAGTTTTTATINYPGSLYNTGYTISVL